MSNPAFFEACLDLQISGLRCGNPAGVDSIGVPRWSPPPTLSGVNTPNFYSVSHQPPALLPSVLPPIAPSDSVIHFLARRSRLQVPSCNIRFVSLTRPPRVSPSSILPLVSPLSTQPDPSTRIPFPSVLRSSIPFAPRTRPLSVSRSRWSALLGPRLPVLGSPPAGRPAPRLSSVYPGPVTQFQFPTDPARMPSREDSNHSLSSLTVSLALCLLRTCIVTVILP